MQSSEDAILSHIMILIESQPGSILESSLADRPGFIRHAVWVWIGLFYLVSCFTASHQDYTKRRIDVMFTHAIYPSVFHFFKTLSPVFFSERVFGFGVILPRNRVFLFFLSKFRNFVVDLATTGFRKLKKV